MAGFGGTVDSLLETYSKCMLLLKGLRGANKNSQPRQLRRRIRSDRSKVRSVYSSRLSLNGTRLEKGDAAARSSLRKIIKRLTSAMTRLLRVMTRTQNPVIDYRSLRSLSNSSRVDAVRTINELSRRLSSSSLRSSPGASMKREDKKRTESPNKRSKSKRAKPAKPAKDKAEPVVKEGEYRPLPLPPPGSSAMLQIDPKKRISLATMSSGSTKLGEIVPKKLRRRQSDYSAASDEFTVQPTFPLRPYLPETKKKKFLGLFGRG
ncbi:hypothetical protein CkaCkLH20_11751 [Colletotrichum karsti]|uniref:Uncharacterized protein n=1 Tax=Colletotrichum karsti TaxID=1095194 RepID=A0A9P6HTT4_9PEZI|nr:uncharacterized protein CkaCkLH20_11751 [Colletotrichum karsti]KAF9870852.1 hypothetical protein CkaCkLH20_11751 [Colletotrichum karsti]